MNTGTNTKCTFKVHSVRTLTSPYAVLTESKNVETIYYVLVDMKQLPANLPLDVNPREPKMNTNVARAIMQAVTAPEADFYINNRGIVISAKSVSFNSAQSELTIDLGDPDSDDKFAFGILDGGHTYTAIMMKRDNIPDDLTQFVRLEVITNVRSIARLSDARNTSAQVSDAALFNLDEKFQFIRDAIQGQMYEDKIAYKDNENKPIHVSELLRLLFCFDIDRYPDDTMAPIQSYSGKAQVFKRYKDAYESDFYMSLTRELPKLVELFDTVQRELPQKYNEYKRMLGTANPHFGSVKSIEAVSSKTTFLNNDVGYKIAEGYIYPIFGAFRCLLHFNPEESRVYWDFDPITIWNEIGTNLTQNIFEAGKDGQLTGKDKQLWLSCYRIVENQSFRKQLQNR